MAARVTRITAPVVLVLVSALLAGCGAERVHLSHDLDRNEFEEEAYESNTPSSYADRWGEPDVWRDEKVGSVLQSTMIWNCVEGETREMVWRLHDQNSGHRRWVLVSEDTREGNCPE